MERLRAIEVAEEKRRKDYAPNSLATIVSYIPGLAFRKMRSSGS
jgi:hypothetical protein